MVHKEKEYVQLLTPEDLVSPFTFGVDVKGVMRVTFQVPDVKAVYQQEDRVKVILNGMTFNILVTKVDYNTNDKLLYSSGVID